MQVSPEAGVEPEADILPEDIEADWRAGTRSMAVGCLEAEYYMKAFVLRERKIEST